VTKIGSTEAKLSGHFAIGIGQQKPGTHIRPSVKNRLLPLDRILEAGEGKRRQTGVPFLLVNFLNYLNLNTATRRHHWVALSKGGVRKWKN
jgi:hypothetical protein